MKENEKKCGMRQWTRNIKLVILHEMSYLDQ